MKELLKNLLNEVVCLKTKGDDIVVGTVESVGDEVVHIGNPLRLAAVPQPNGQMAMIFLNPDLSPASPNNISVDMLFVRLDSIEYAFKVKEGSELYTHYKTTVSGLALPKQNDDKVMKLIQNLNKQQGGNDA